jgi:eukaryotic-like serine/threonine-protein kinase
MTPSEWAEIKRIFQEALDLPPSERIAFVAAASAGNNDLRREVESLLAAEETSDGFLSEAAVAFVPEALDEIEDNNLGRRIGPYQIVRQIGSGGMGAVYLAERVDEFRRQVALKLMRPGMDSRAVVSRFRYERQILAGLDHPNIAKLLDGGATDDARPYFVMEYVEGMPIDAWCAKHAAGIPDRLRLFLQVCAAVQYAHQNLVVHRDLKPGNILVATDGTPKLLDFGIAKLLRQEEAQETAGLTQMGVRLMTPEFASPEQVRGLPVTTATDVYSLGVILYELLSGRPPYLFETRSPVEVEHIVTTREAPPPSSIAAPESARRLTGDLDVIVLKALEKDPQRRYISVEQFAADIQRHLDGIPILARPQTWRYRAGRFARRNRVPVLAASLIVLSLAGGLVAATWQARIARQQRARAERNFSDLRRLTQSFLFDFHDSIKDLPGSTPARNLVVQTAVDYLRRLSQEARGDPSLARDVAEAWLRLGDVQGNQYGINRGDSEAALASYRQALAIADDLVKRDPGNADGRFYLARAHRAVGELLPVRGEVAEAVPHFRAAIATLEGATDDRARLELSRCYETLGDVLGHQGLANLSDPAGARAAYEKSLALDQGIGSKRGAAVLRMKLGDLDFDAGDPAAALREFRTASAVFYELAAAAPLHTGAQREAAMIHRKIGDATAALGQIPAALDEYRQAAAITRALMAADPSNRQARIDYTVGLKTRADLLYKTGDFPGALALYREVLGILGPESAAQPGNQLLRSRYAEMLLNVGDLMVKPRPSDEGRRLYADGLRIRKELADRSTATAEDLDDYAESLIDCPIPDLARPADAVVYARRAVEQSKGAVPEYVDRLALALFQAGHASEAVATQQKALALMPPTSPARKGAEERLARYRKSRP